MIRSITCFVTSSVGLKCIMACSGLLMVGFLVGHMGGNLLIFLGPDTLNNYAATLHNMPLLLWSTRIGLLTALIAHVSSAITLTHKNRKARGGRHKNIRVKSSWTSRHMALTGTLVLAYIFYHLAHFTWKLTHPNFALFPQDVYGMIIQSFQNGWVSAIYLISMGLLGMHLYHGIQSSWESLGLYHSSYTPIMRCVAKALSIVLILGFSSIPIAVWSGFLT